MKIGEKIFSIGFLFINIGVVAYVVGNISHVLAPDVGPTGRYQARRLRVLSFCRQHNLPMHLQNEVSTHLELEYASNLEPSEEHGIFKSLPMPICKMILNYLYNNYMTDSYLFEGVSNAIRLQLVHEMEPVFYLANSTVILQDEFPVCFYFVVRGSVELKSFKNGVERDAGTAIAGNVFGQSCVLCNKPQLFTAKTREVCQLLKLDRDTLNDILKENPIAASNIMDNEILILKELVEEHNDPDMTDVLGEIERKKARDEAPGIA
ncbi:putative potassium channel, voltage-dependent, EAG/ELK/ERG [Medicago truncatula]|uniref:Potassium channel n=1 Tax=Medicago truncatula TaxID=3880 RepID=A0A396IE85_MEDTR|nr:putative potassium channel, voltage-dependent, EAG/ELK/ERG [Medicago truncatula]